MVQSDTQNADVIRTICWCEVTLTAIDSALFSYLLAATGG